jgi:carbamoyltransferase
MLAEKAKKLTDSKNICVAGGSFLNCNSNEKILNSGLFEIVFSFLHLMIVESH